MIYCLVWLEYRWGQNLGFINEDEEEKLKNNLQSLLQYTAVINISKTIKFKNI
jgi:hypothetical protein